MKKITSFMLMLLCAMTAWAQTSLHVSETLPGTLNGSQYEWKSQSIQMPEGHNKLRVTFLENTNRNWRAGFPMVCIAEFYLYDKNGNQVELTADRFSSNATQSGEGKMEAICNGSTAKKESESATDWYWHSQWSGTPNPYGYHYLEVNLEGIADLSEYSIGWVTRIQDASPTEVVISTGTSSDDAGKNANVHMLPKVSTENNIILYTIKSARSGKFLAFTYNNEQPVQQDGKSYWYFTAGTDGKYVVHNIATDQVLNHNLKMQADGEWCILPAQYRSGMVFAIDADNLGNTGNCIDEQGDGTRIGTWKHTRDDNHGTTWIITEARDADFAIFELQNKVIESIGAPAKEIESGKWYILNNVGRGNYVSQEVTNWKMRATSTIAEGQKAEAKAGYLFKITKNGDNYNIISGNGKYFQLGRNTASTSATPVNFEIGLIGESADNFYIFDKDHGYTADGQETNNAFVGWATTPPSSTGGNDSYKLLPVELEAGVEYIYDYYLNGTKIASETLVTEEFAGLEKYYGVSSNNIPTGAAAKGTYKVNITDNLPFEYSNSLENATNWYFVKMHSNEPGYIHDDENNHLPFYGGDGGTVVAEDDTRYRFAWAFVGDPINGFKVVNNVTRQAITSNGSGDATTTEVENATKWLAKASDVKKDDARYFTLKYPTNNQYLNANNNANVKKLSHWDEADAGSTIILDEVADEYNYAITDEAENVYSGKFTYGGNKGYMTFNGAYGHTLSNEVFNIAERKYTANIKFPYPVSKVGGATNETLLVLKGNSRYIRLNENDVYVSNEAVDASCYWAIYPAYSNGGFTFTIKNVSTGKYLYSDAAKENHEKGTVALSETPTQFTYVNRFNKNDDCSSFKIADKNLVLSINSPGTNAYLGVWNYTHGGANYVSAPITEYKVNITDAKYATFYAPVAVTVPEGVTAHTITIQGDWAVLSDEALTVIPAYTGVVLYSKTPNTYTFNVKDEEVAAIENNVLTGTVAATYVTGNAYVLGINDGEVGFYTATTAGQEEGIFLNNHHKAYLPKAKGMSNTIGYRFNFGGTTAIEEVETEVAETVIYDLTGRRVNEITKAGVYIINGKKTLVK